MSETETHTETVTLISELLADMRVLPWGDAPAEREARAAWYERKALVMERVGAEDPRQAETARQSATAARANAQRLREGTPL